MNLRFYIIKTALSVMLALFVAAPVFAQDDTESKVSDKEAAALIKALREQSDRLEEHEKKLVEQEKAMSEQRSMLAQERIKFEKLQTQVITLTGRPLPMKPKDTKTAAAQNTNKTSSGAPEEVGTDRKEEAKEKPPEVAAVIDQGGVLTSRGKIVVTPAVEYSHSSATSVAISGFAIIPAINIGLFDIAQVNRDMVTPSIDLRYGLTNRIEIEGKVPYVWRKDTTLARPVGVPGATDSLSSVDGSGIGDVEFAGHYQINNGLGGWPFLIGNLRFKTATGESPFEVPVVNGLETRLPTGSGFYALQPSVTAIFPSDPVVYYSNFGYLHNFARSFPQYGRVEPGDGFSGSMGMSLSLNDKSSFSLGYSHTMVLKTFINNAPIANSDILQIGTVDLGFSYNLTDRTNLNFSISAGVTSDAPDVRLIFRVPMTFDLM